MVCSASKSFLHWVQRSFQKIPPELRPVSKEVLSVEARHRLTAEVPEALSCRKVDEIITSTQSLYSILTLPTNNMHDNSIVPSDRYVVTQVELRRSSYRFFAQRTQTHVTKVTRVHSGVLHLREHAIRHGERLSGCPRFVAKQGL